MSLMAYIVACCIALSYVGAFFFFQLFFERKIIVNKLSLRSLYTMLGLFVLNLAVVGITAFLPEPFGNRLLHAVGGGVLTFVACFCAAIDSGIVMTRFQFLVLASLLVTALGVGNELVEWMFQSTTHLIFAESIEDTWLDLMSNTLGISCTAFAVFPFLKKISRNT